MSNQNGEDKEQSKTSIGNQSKNGLIGSALKNYFSNNSPKAEKQKHDDSISKSDIVNDRNLKSPERDEKEDKSAQLIEEVPKFFMKVLQNIKKEKGINIFNSFEYIINCLINMHFEKKANASKVDAFRNTWNLEKVPANEEIFVRFMETFKEFNFFDYVKTHNHHKFPTEVEVTEMRKFYIQRNNIFLRILTIISQFTMRDKDYYSRQVDSFIKINNENTVEIELDVDFFFLSLLGYHDKAKSFLIKHNEYFKYIIRELKTVDPVTFFDENLMLKHEFTIENYITFRKIMCNIAKRKFFDGFYFLISSNYSLDYVKMLMEGRVWKHIIINFKDDKIIKMWQMFHKKCYTLTEDEYVPTIQYTHYRINYNKKLNLNTNNPEDVMIIEEYNEEFSLGPVFDLRSLLIILFKYVKREVAFELVQEGLKNQEVDITVFDISLIQDEEISIMLAEQLVTDETAQKYYFEMALTKKFFKLAYRLMNYSKCREVLDTPPPVKDRSHIIMKNLNKDSRKMRQTRMKNEINNMSEDGYYVVQNSLIEGNGDDQTEFTKVSTLTDQPGSVKKSNKIDNMTIVAPSIDLTKGVVMNAAEEKSSLKKMMSKQISSTAPLKKKNTEEIRRKREESLKKKVSNASLFKMNQSIGLNASNNSFSRPQLEEKEYQAINQTLNNNKEEILKTDDKLLLPQNRSKNNSITSTPKTELKVNETELTDIPQRKEDKEDEEIDEEEEEEEEDEEDGIEEQDVNMTVFNAEYYNKKIAQNSGKIDVQNILIECLRNGEHVYYCLNLLSSINDSVLNLQHAEKICKSLGILLKGGTDPEILLTRYPIIVCVLGAELLIKIGNMYAKFFYKCQSVSSGLLELGCSIQDSIKSEDTLKYYLQKHVDWKGRNTLEIIAENRFYNYLKNPTVAAMVNKLWYGNDESGDIFTFSSICAISFSSIRYEKYNDVIQKNEEEKHINPYSFQFNQYIYNCSLRNIISAISQVLVAVLFEYIIFNYVVISSDGNIPMEDESFYWFNFIGNILVFSTNLNFLTYILYLSKTKRKIEFNLNMTLELLLFLAVLFDILELDIALVPYQSYITGIFFNTTYYEQSELSNQFLLNSTSELGDSYNFGNSTFKAVDKVPTFNYKTNDGKLINGIVYSFIIVCAWFKVILVMITTHTFGPFLRIVYLLLGIMFNFGLVYFCFNFLFAQMFTLFFNKVNETDFSGFFRAFVSLFNATFGQYNLGNYKMDNDNKIIGYLFTCFYVIIANIMLLSLFVAIVSRQYQSHKSAADSENRVILILTHESIKWDSKWGLLILVPPPLNIISFVLVLILLIIPESKLETVNMALSKFCFIFICFINFFTLTVTNILLYPIALLKSYLHTLSEVKKLTAVEFFKGFGLLLFRPFQYLYFIGKDLFIFWKITFKTEDEKSEEEVKQIIFEKAIIIRIRKVLLKYEYKSKKKNIHLVKLLQELKVVNPENLKNCGLDISNYTRGWTQNSNNNTSLVESLSNNKDSTDVASEDLDISKAESSNSIELIFGENNNRLTDEQISALINVCNKFADKENYINISRTLVLLENRLWMSDNYKKYIEMLNMKYLLKGVLNFHQRSLEVNCIYEYKKIGHVLNKIYLKLKLLMKFIPQDCGTRIVHDYEELNEDYLEKKTYTYMKNVNEKDDMSEYGDDYDEDLIKISKKSGEKVTYFNVASNNRKNIDKLTRVLKNQANK